MRGFIFMPKEIIFIIFIIFITGINSYILIKSGISIKDNMLVLNIHVPPSLTEAELLGF